MDEGAEMRNHGLVTTTHNGQTRRRLAAWGLVGTAALLYPPTLYLGLAAGSEVPSLVQFDWWSALTPLAAIELGVVAALVLRRHPDHAVGWVALAGCLSTALYAFAGAYAAFSLTHGRVLPAPDVALWLRGWLWYPASMLLFSLLPLLFPDGRLPSPRWWLVVLTLTAGSLIQLTAVTLSTLILGVPLANAPQTGGGKGFGILLLLSGALWVLSIVGAAAAVAVRFRGSAGAARQQLKWFLAAVAVQAEVWAGSVAASTVPAVSAYAGPVFAVLVPLTLLLMPIAIGLAILQHRLYDVDLVISRGLVYAGLLAFITIGYLLLVIVTGVVFGSGGGTNLTVAVIAMALVALLVQPLRFRLERMANRLVFGMPADPYAILGELSRSPGVGDVDQALDKIAQAVARGMGSRRARVRLLLPGAASRSATWPSGAEGMFGKSTAISYAGETVGGIEADGSGDQRLAEALSAQTGHALHTLRLAAELDARLAQLEAQAEELAASRTRLVQAHEAERRRLERDLHDGIQQQLVAMIATARLARNELARDPGAAAATLSDLQSNAQQAVQELRSLTRGIHPAVLSSRGLVEAIEAMAARAPLDVRVHANGGVRDFRYRPEIESAAYFVVSEALSNVLKHAAARMVQVEISSGEDRLCVAVSDDGHGFDPELVALSGLRGLRDRIEALGGELAIQSGSGGTRVGLLLPVGEGADA